MRGRKTGVHTVGVHMGGRAMGMRAAGVHTEGVHTAVYLDIHRKDTDVAPLQLLEGKERSRVVWEIVRIIGAVALLHRGHSSELTGGRGLNARKRREG